MSESTRMSLTKRIRAAMDAPSDRLDDLVRASGIDPCSDLQFGDWRGFNLKNADLRRFNFTGADLTGALFDGARVAGAIFDSAKYDLASLYKAQDVICFTPKRRLIALEPNATAVDFAKALQPENSAVSAVKINGKNAPLTSILNNGDQVEIVALKAESRKPSREHDAPNSQHLASFRVGRSRSGLGLFATGLIKKGAFIAEFTGPLLNNDQCNKIADNRYLFEVNTRWTIKGSSRSNVARYVNHSCRPNAETYIRNRRVKIRAIKNIKSGDEIAFDYGKDHFNAFIKPKGCKCIKCVKDSEVRYEPRTVSKQPPVDGKSTQISAAQTMRSVIDRKRSDLMGEFARRERVDLRNTSKALYRSDEDSLSAVCTLSKRYERRYPQYWYGYSPRWKKFLSQSPRGFLVLGCIDREMAYAVPNTAIDGVLNRLYRTPKRHWHIVLEEDEPNKLSLITRNGVKISIDKYKLRADR